MIHVAPKLYTNVVVKSIPFISWQSFLLQYENHVSVIKDYKLNGFNMIIATKTANFNGMDFKKDKP